MDCKAGIKFRLTDDGSGLEIVKITEDHTHFVSKEAFKHLPQNRRLDQNMESELKEMLKVKPNKKLVQEYLMKRTGKIITLKDIHNIDQKLRSPDNSLIALLGEMKKEKDSVAELIVREDEELCAIYYQDSNMQQTFAKFPELLCIDATYKLNDRRMPLYVLMCVDGNGESHVVALWIVSSEEKDVISALMDIFLKHNATDHIKVIMADKDMVERKVMTEKLPSASLQICLFHTLRTFRREISTEKLGIKPDQRLVVLEIIEKLVYSKDLETYDAVYQNLKDMKFQSVTEYVESNWHPIREEWVEGLKRQSANLMNSTNNRVESINQKFKTIVSKHSGMVDFFKGVKSVLHSLGIERNHRSLALVQKVPNTAFSTPAEKEYSALATPYAFSFLKLQLNQIADPLPETTINTCACGFFCSMGLPCKHIFSFRRLEEQNLYSAELVAQRWQRQYFLESLPVFVTPNISYSTPPSPITVSHVEVKSSGPLAQHEKFRKASHIANRICGIISESTGTKFMDHIESLMELEEILKKGSAFKAVELQYMPASDDITQSPETPIETQSPQPSTSGALFQTPQANPQFQTPQANPQLPKRPVPLPRKRLRLQKPEGSDNSIEAEEIETRTPENDSHSEDSNAAEHETSTPENDSIDEIPTGTAEHENSTQVNDCNNNDSIDVIPTAEHENSTQENDCNNNDSIDVIPTAENYPSTQENCNDVTHSDESDNDLDSTNNSLEIRNIDVTRVKMPPKMAKRGRSKGADLTAIGLTRKRKRTSPAIVPFIKLSPDEKERIILPWVIKPKGLQKVLSKEKLAGKCDLLHWQQIPLKATDETVTIYRIKEYFTSVAWIALQSLLKRVKDRNLELCKVCAETLSGSFAVCCSLCLEWYDRKCSGLKAQPKKRHWFCTSCLNNN